MNQDENTITFKFTPQSMQELQQMAQKMGTSIEGVISEALGLLKTAQGKTVILKDKAQNKSLEIKKFA